MKKIYLTPAEAEEYAALHFSIQAFEAARDRHMALIKNDMEFLRQLGIQRYPTEPPPTLPGFQSIDDQNLTEEESIHE